MQFENFFPIFLSHSLLSWFIHDNRNARPRYLGCKCQLTGDTRGLGLPKACVPATWDANTPERLYIFGLGNSYDPRMYVCMLRKSGRGYMGINFMPGKQFPRVWRETGGKYLLNNTDKTKEASVLCGNPNYGDEGNWIWKNWNGVDFESVHAELWSLINWIRKYRKDFWDVFIFYSRELWVIEEELMIWYTL